MFAGDGGADVDAVVRLGRSRVQQQTVALHEPACTTSNYKLCQPQPSAASYMQCMQCKCKFVADKSLDANVVRKRKPPQCIPSPFLVVSMTVTEVYKKTEIKRSSGILTLWKQAGFIYACPCTIETSFSKKSAKSIGIFRKSRKLLQTHLGSQKDSWSMESVNFFR